MFKHSFCDCRNMPKTRVNTSMGIKYPIGNLTRLKNDYYSDKNERRIKMPEKTKNVREQIEELGIDCDKLHQIGGGLDNIKELMHILSETVEHYTSPEDITKAPSILLIRDIQRVVQLSFIFDNELERVNNALNVLIEQIEK